MELVALWIDVRQTVRHLATLVTNLSFMFRPFLDLGNSWSAQQPAIPQKGLVIITVLYCPSMSNHAPDFA